MSFVTLHRPEVLTTRRTKTSRERNKLSLHKSRPHSGLSPGSVRQIHIRGGKVFVNSDGVILPLHLPVKKHHAPVAHWTAPLRPAAWVRWCLLVGMGAAIAGWLVFPTEISTRQDDQIVETVLTQAQYQWIGYHRIAPSSVD